MKIRIYSITLHNFKGVVGEKSYDFGAENARIEGENGTGKSTVFDAFTWLLFGKDHLGHDWTNFDLKPIDPETKEPMHQAPGGHWVEAFLDIDGRARTVRRVVEENWVKPRGETEAVFKGHMQSFYIDGVACATKKEYDETIHEWIDEEVFKILTNPLYFIDNTFTKWEARRKVLLSVVGYDPRVADADFPDVVAEAKGEPMEMFRKRIAAAKKAQREDLDRCLANIKAWKEVLPQVVDVEAVEKEIEEIRLKVEADKKGVTNRIAEIDRAIEDAAAANKEVQERANAKQAEIWALKQKMTNYIDEGLTAARSQNETARKAVSVVSQEVAEIEEALSSLRVQEKSLERRVKELTEARDDEASRLSALGERYNREKEMAFVPDIETVCPTCGRPYPVETVAAETEARREKWKEERAAAVAKIKDQALEIRAELNKWLVSLAGAEGSLAKTREEIKLKEDEQLLALDRVDAAKAAVPQVSMADEELRLRKSEAYMEMAAQVAEMEGEVEDMRLMAGGNPTELMAERRAREAQIAVMEDDLEIRTRPLRDSLAVAKERERIEAKIEAEDKRRKGFADELARLERLEQRTLEYIKASVDACESAINSRFKAARWKMFDRTLDGGIVPMCEVTTIEGVPFVSMNSAARMVCGLDVIRVLSEAHDVVAPIFIDNAEGVTRTQFDIEAQVVRLVVVPGVKEAVVVSEAKAGE